MKKCFLSTNHSSILHGVLLSAGSLCSPKKLVKGVGRGGVSSVVRSLWANGMLNFDVLVGGPSGGDNEVEYAELPSA
jgi:hypothetical protein